ncbi:MAG: META domain-containing protein [Bacilli bacterium]|nr:META domain-containing protein [Bacilli bacterium]
MKKAFVIVSLALVLFVYLFLSFHKNSDKLEDSSWQLSDWTLNCSIVAPITLNFEGNEISGNGGVNSYSGEYEINGEEFIISNLVSTEMASLEPDINNAESGYFSALSEVRYYELSDSDLSLLNNNKEVVLIYEKK